SFASDPPHLALPSFPTRRSSDLVTLTEAELSLSHVGSIISRDRVRARSVARGSRKCCVLKANARGSLNRFRTLGEAEAHYFDVRSEEHTSELQSRENLVCRLLLE